MGSGFRKSREHALPPDKTIGGAVRGPRFRLRVMPAAPLLLAQSSGGRDYRPPQLRSLYAVFVLLLPVGRTPP